MLRIHDINEAVIFSAAAEILVNAPQHAVNLATHADNAVNNVAQGDVSPNSIKNLLLVCAGGYSLFKAVV